jgi:hypothetical protein
MESRNNISNTTLKVIPLEPSSFSKTHTQFNQNVTCITLNCHSVLHKDILIGQYLREENIDFALLTETWYSNDRQDQIDTSDLNQNGYKICAVNRPNRTGGGIALVHRTGVNVRKSRVHLKIPLKMAFGNLCSKTFQLRLLAFIDHHHLLLILSL